MIEKIIGNCRGFVENLVTCKFIWAADSVKFVTMQLQFGCEYQINNSESHKTPIGRACHT